MKAILYSDWEKLELVEVPKPEPGGGRGACKGRSCRHMWLGN